jgi:hypothetical protein
MLDVFIFTEIVGQTSEESGEVYSKGQVKSRDKYRQNNRKQMRTAVVPSKDEVEYPVSDELGAVLASKPVMFV